MNRRSQWSRTLFIVGLSAMIVAALDPLEGSIVILFGSALIAAGAALTPSRYRSALYWSCLLVALGVASLLVMSAIGGIGGNTGRSMWWSILLIPYVVGWLSGIVFGVRRVRDGFA